MPTSKGFPVIDITHKPKRMQSDNLRGAVSMSTVYGADTETNTSSVPATPTLEKAIAYYESHAEGEYRVLYSQTAKWLREYLSKSVPVPEVLTEPVEE